MGVSSQYSTLDSYINLGKAAMPYHPTASEIEVISFLRVGLKTFMASDLACSMSDTLLGQKAGGNITSIHMNNFNTVWEALTEAAGMELVANMRAAIRKSTFVGRVDIQGETVPPGGHFAFPRRLNKRQDPTSDPCRYPSPTPNPHTPIPPKPNQNVGPRSFSKKPQLQNLPQLRHHQFLLMITPVGKKTTCTCFT